ncbi:hypothetical protein CPEBRM1_ABPJDJAI_02527 [Companilactobacillus paralimentarius]|uniref:hypothetical protein n=1 Tax=Companilactobacillus paralimentarius TaxID=83526 RepID=UPI00384E766D
MKKIFVYLITASIMLTTTIGLEDENLIKSQLSVNQTTIINNSLSAELSNDIPYH